MLSNVQPWMPGNHKSWFVGPLAPPTPNMDMLMTPKFLFPQEFSLINAQVPLKCKLFLTGTEAFRLTSDCLQSSLWAAKPWLLQAGHWWYSMDITLCLICLCLVFFSLPRIFWPGMEVGGQWIDFLCFRSDWATPKHFCVGFPGPSKDWSEI